MKKLLISVLMVFLLPLGVFAVSCAVEGDGTYVPMSCPSRLVDASWQTLYSTPTTFTADKYVVYFEERVGAQAVVMRDTTGMYAQMLPAKCRIAKPQVMVWMMNEMDLSSDNHDPGVYYFCKNNVTPSRRGGWEFVRESKGATGVFKVQLI